MKSAKIIYQTIQFKLPFQGAKSHFNPDPRRCHWAEISWAFSPYSFVLNRHQAKLLDATFF